MQLPSDPQLKAVSALLGTEWISLEDIQTKMSSLKRSQRSSVAHPDTLCIKSADDTVVTEAGTVDKKDRCWCCCCCRKGSSTSTKKAAQKYELSNTNVNANPGDVTLEQQMRELEKKDTVVTIQPGRIKSASVECVNFGDATIGRFGSNMNSLRRAADSVQGRCTAIYNKINEPGTPLRIGIERYFEQDRGILVLNTESLGVGSGVTVVCICTLLEHAQKLREDQYKRLTSDLERVISNAYGTPVRLEVKVDDNELDLVELEMASR